MTRSFWKNALASLPPAVQRRYAADFAMAERLDRSLDIALDAWSSGKRTLARNSGKTLASTLTATRGLRSSVSKL